MTGEIEEIGVEGEEEEEGWTTRGEEECKIGGMKMRKWRKMRRIEE